MNRYLLAALFSGALFFSATAAQAQCTATTPSAIAAKIGAGHAYQKHVVTGGEFKAGKVIAGLAMPATPVVNNVVTFSALIQTVMGSSTNRTLSGGRKAYWHSGTGTIVVFDPKNVDCGTAFRPVKGKPYYDTTT